jgi:hypothetical protein
MLATFIHTAGLTGTEVGVAAATAFLNQKLLGALFGEAAMVELIGRARRRLDAALEATFAEERARFDALLPDADDLTELAADLRALADEIRSVAPEPGPTPSGPQSDTQTPGRDPEPSTPPAVTRRR